MLENFRRPIMKISIFGKNYNPSESLVKITEKKCAKFEKRLGEDAELKFTVALQNEEYTTDLQVTCEKGTFRVSAESRSPFDNLDIVIPRLEGQLRKQKDIEENGRRPEDDD